MRNPQLAAYQKLMKINEIRCTYIPLNRAWFQLMCNLLCDDSAVGAATVARVVALTAVRGRGTQEDGMGLATTAFTVIRWCNVVRQTALNVVRQTALNVVRQTALNAKVGCDNVVRQTALNGKVGCDNVFRQTALNAKVGCDNVVRQTALNAKVGCDNVVRQTALNAKFGCDNIVRQTALNA